MRLRGRAGCSPCAGGASCFLWHWGERGCLHRRRGTTRAHRPTARSAFPCWGKLRHEKRACFTQRGKRQVSYITDQCPSPPPGGGPQDGEGQGVTQRQKSPLARAEDTASCGSTMSPMGKLQPSGAAWDGVPLGASPGSGPTLCGCLCSKGRPAGRKEGESCISVAQDSGSQSFRSAQVSYSPTAQGGSLQAAW